MIAATPIAAGPIATGPVLGATPAKAIAAARGAATLVGRPVGLLAGHMLAATTATFAIADVAAQTRRSFRAQAFVQGVALYGPPATIRQTRRMAAGSTALTMTAWSGSLSARRQVAAAPAVLALSSKAATFSRLGAYAVATGGAGLVLAAAPAQLLLQRLLVADARAISVAGGDAALGWYRRCATDGIGLVISFAPAELVKRGVGSPLLFGPGQILRLVAAGSTTLRL
jgi:hypothetical protein